MDDKVKKAVREWYDRNHGSKRPDATFEENARGMGVWKPTNEERRECCNSYAEGQLYRHCFSVEHCSHLFGADVKEVSREVRRMRNGKSRSF